MKQNWLALLIILCMVCSGVAVAEGAQETAFPLWENGQSAQQPYGTLPEVNLTEKLGYMMFYPTNGSVADRATRTLEIFLPRTDVSAGDGMISLLDAKDGTVLASFAMSDSEHVTLSAANEKDLKWLKWETGVQILVTLDATLYANHEFYVTLDEGAIVAEGYGISNPEMMTKRGWAFSTDSDYGVENVALNEDSSATVHVLLGGDAVTAYPIILAEGELTSDVEMLTASGTITITLSSADVQWGIVFVDARDKVLAVYEH